MTKEERLDLTLRVMSEQASRHIEQSEHNRRMLILAQLTREAQEMGLYDMPPRNSMDRNSRS